MVAYYLIDCPHLHPFLQRTRSTDEERPNQSRVGVFNRLYCRVVHVGQAVRFPLHRSSTHRHHPLIGVNSPRSDQGSGWRSHHS